MALLRASRDRRGPDPHTNIKIAVFAIGAALALIGMFLKNDWFIYAAIGVLAIGVILRLITMRAERRQYDVFDHDDLDEPTDKDDTTAPTEPRN